jgi:pseudouridine kinase
VKIACIGGAHIDRHAVLKQPFVPASSNPCNIATSFGGVARNVAENLARLGCSVSLVSRVGDDEAGRAVLAHLNALGIDTSMVSTAPRPTASYTAVLDPAGELVAGLADMDIYDDLVNLPPLLNYDLRFADTNIPAETLASLAAHAPLAVDAISVAKSRKLRHLLPSLSLLFATVAQARELTHLHLSTAADAARALHHLGATSGIVTHGPKGIAAWIGEDVLSLPILPAEPRNVTGAGDALIAGTLFGLTEGRSLFAAVPLGLAAAAITVESGATVADNLTVELLHARLAAHRA